MEQSSREEWIFKELMLKEEIKSSNVLNTHLKRDCEDDKQGEGILDVHIELEDGTDIDIEMQIISFKEWVECTLFYTNKMYVERIETEYEYNVLRKCIDISVLDFIYLDQQL